MLSHRESELLELIGCCAWCDAAMITAESHRAGIVVYQGGSVVGIWNERDDLVFRTIDDLQIRARASSAGAAHLRTIAMATSRSWFQNVSA
jgi:hypothetical protein